MKEKTIDGIQFCVVPFSAVDALRLKAHLIGLFGPALGTMFGSLQGAAATGAKIGDIKIDGGAVTAGIESLVSKLDENSFVSLIKRLFSRLTAKLPEEGKTLQFAFTESYFETSMDKVFSGRLMSIYPVIGFVLEANFPDFFEKTVRSIGSRIAQISTTASGSASETNTPASSET
jgi:hypothetical protein